jgi:hypothetical protein
VDEYWPASSILADGYVLTPHGSPTGTGELQLTVVPVDDILRIRDGVMSGHTGLVDDFPAPMIAGPIYTKSSLLSHGKSICLADNEVSAI